MRGSGDNRASSARLSSVSPSAVFAFIVAPEKRGPPSGSRWNSQPIRTSAAVAATRIAGRRAAEGAARPIQGAAAGTGAA